MPVCSRYRHRARRPDGRAGRRRRRFISHGDTAIKHLRLSVIVLLWAALVAGCAPPQGPTGKQIAIKKADAILDAIKAQDFKRAASLYSTQFYKITTPASWQAHLEKIHEKYGDLKGYRLEKVIVNSVYSGARFSLKFRTNYAKRDAVETMVFFRPINGDKIEIATHEMEILPKDM